MKTIRARLKKPSAAVDAMIEGLLQQSKRTDFYVAMESFGGFNGNTCFGCAATCTVQQIAGENLYAGQHPVLPKDRAKILGFKEMDLTIFEMAIDEFRRGNPGKLLAYFRVPFFQETKPVFTLLGFKLESRNWREQLDKVREYSEKLKALDL